MSDFGPSNQVGHLSIWKDGQASELNTIGLVGSVACKWLSKKDLCLCDAWQNWQYEEQLAIISILHFIHQWQSPAMALQLLYQSCWSQQAPTIRTAKASWRAEHWNQKVVNLFGTHNFLQVTLGSRPVSWWDWDWQHLTSRLHHSNRIFQPNKEAQV